MGSRIVLAVTTLAVVIYLLAYVADRADRPIVAKWAARLVWPLIVSAALVWAVVIAMSRSSINLF